MEPGASFANYRFDAELLTIRPTLRLQFELALAQRRWAPWSRRRMPGSPRGALLFQNHIAGIARNSNTSIDAPGDVKCGWLFRRFISASFDSAWRIE